MPFCLICPVSGLGVAGLFKHGGLVLGQYVIVETNRPGLVGDDHTSTDDGADQVRQCACGATLPRLNVEGVNCYFDSLLKCGQQ